jgi:hypothetical protein
MKLKLTVAVAVLAVVGACAAPAPPARSQRLEYKVVFAKVDGVGSWQRGQNGKMEEVAGPAKSAEAMTKQFNDLAAEGWEYVGPTTSTSREGVLILFKRLK